ncbi:MAG: serine/threonine-protein kinase [Pirellulales bacterium]
MDHSRASILRQAAVASGLIEPRQIDAALRIAAESEGGLRPPDEIDDDRLGDVLIELGMLNRWQVGQLKAGRTKFTLGPYHIIDSIGQGGMGHVFKGEHAMLGRIEAVKVLPKSKTTPDSIASFQREIRAQAQLDHPNLVRVSYAGQDGDTYFFVTEFVPGTDLRRLVRSRGLLTMQEAATIIAQAAQGLQYAHQRGLVHRDIKPGNLLVTPEGRTKVTDLGLAWYLTDDPQADDERTAKIVGTADYLAPETIRNPATVSPVSDIYALGCTAYYAVTGKVPFPGGNTADKLRWHCEAMPLNPQRFNAMLSDAFIEVLGDMMEKDPRRRLATAREAAERLAPWTLNAVPARAKTSIAGPPSVPFPPPEGLEDTAPQLFNEQDIFSEDQDSFSQASQGTEPFASASQETLTLDRILRRRRKPLQFSLTTLVLVPLIVVLAVLLLMLLDLLR